MAPRGPQAASRLAPDSSRKRRRLAFGAEIIGDSLKGVGSFIGRRAAPALGARRGRCNARRERRERGGPAAIPDVDDDRRLQLPHHRRRCASRPGPPPGSGAIAGARLGRRVLVVTDPACARLGLADAALAEACAALAEVDALRRVEADPVARRLDGGGRGGRAAGATGVVGFGGGSSLDVAKLVALLLGSGEDLDGAWGVGNAKGPRLPLVLVPTTAGTGSEVTPVSIITVAATRSAACPRPLLLPDLARARPGPDARPAGRDHRRDRDRRHGARDRGLRLAQPQQQPGLAGCWPGEALRLLGGNIETAVRDGADLRGAGGDAARLDAGGAGLRQFARWRRCMRSPIRSAGASTCRTACRTRWCCRMCCASTRRRPRRDYAEIGRACVPRPRAGRAATFAEGLAALVGAARPAGAAARGRRRRRPTCRAAPPTR